MPNVAILVGNTSYRKMNALECCHEDVEAMAELLRATEKYDEITIIENAEADTLKSRIRTAVDSTQSPHELFFYFTGHGHQHETEFFFCATDFDSDRPNQTGLSISEFHTLLRPANAELVVQVVDACYSGTLMFKSDGTWISHEKAGFRNVIRFASCLESQQSLTGDPLSLFTDKFISASIRKTEGVVFYTDIMNSLRDEFLTNNNQTPYFISQSTGREQFAEDARRLGALRQKIENQTRPPTIDAPIASAPITLLDRLRLADTRVLTPEKMQTLVAQLFDALAHKLLDGDFSEYFTVEKKEHSDFYEPTTEQFIIRVLSKEKRPDNFVTANHSRKFRRQSSHLGGIGNIFSNYTDEAPYEDVWELSLNCTMTRTQLRITLTPRFMNLQQIVLVVSCAPSLDHCYIFEMATQHLLTDFGKFDNEGVEISRRYWKSPWSNSTNGIVQQIIAKLRETVQTHLESAEKRLQEVKSN